MDSRTSSLLPFSRLSSSSSTSSTSTTSTQEYVQDDNKLLNEANALASRIPEEAVLMDPKKLLEGRVEVVIVLKDPKKVFECGVQAVNRLLQIDTAKVDPNGSAFFGVTWFVYQKLAMLANNYEIGPKDDKNRIFSSVECDYYQLARKTFFAGVRGSVSSKGTAGINNETVSYAEILEQHREVMDSMVTAPSSTQRIAILEGWGKFLAFVQDGRIPQSELRQQVLGERHDELAAMVKWLNKTLNALKLFELKSKTLASAAAATFYNTTSVAVPAVAAPAPVQRERSETVADRVVADHLAKRRR